MINKNCMMIHTGQRNGDTWVFMMNAGDAVAKIMATGKKAIALNKVEMDLISMIVRCAKIHG